jgi:Holliday junction resolvase
MPLRNQTKRFRSQIQERNLAKKFNGVVRPGSGAFPMLKGDCKTPYYLMEAKRTDKKQMILKTEWLDKIVKEANRTDRLPILALEIGNRRWIICEENDFQVLCQSR